MKREVYLHMNERLHPRESSVEYIVAYAKRKRHTALKKIGVTLIAAALLSGSLTLGASASEDFQQALFDISPEIAATFSPVMKSCVSEGIRMTVEAVHLNGDDAEVIVAFEDVTGQNRTESLDLCDSYDLRRGLLPFAGEMATAGITGDYDPETGIMRKHIYFNQPGTVDQEGQTITFSVRKAVTGMRKEWDIEMPVDLSAVPCDPPTRSAEETLVYRDIYGGIGASDATSEEYEAFTEMEKVYLVPNTSIPLGEGVEITAVGWIDGYLHIQQRISKRPETNSAGYYLYKDGEPRYGSFSVSWSPEKGCICEENFIPMTSEELREYRLYGYVIAGGTEIDGNWKVKFKLKETG